MENKQKAIKTSSRVISILMKIGYIASIVEMCICVAGVIFVAATGGQSSFITSGGLKIVAIDAPITTGKGLIALCVAAFVVGAFLFAIFFLTHRIFSEISKTGTPFNAKYVTLIKAVGVLIVAMSFIGGIVDSAAAATAEVATMGMDTDSTGIVFGIIVFCLAYIFDYGCMLQQQSDETL